MEFSHFCVQGSNSSGNSGSRSRRTSTKWNFSMCQGSPLSSRLCLPRKLFCHMCSELFSLESKMIIFGFILHTIDLNSSKASASISNCPIVVPHSASSVLSDELWPSLLLNMFASQGTSVCAAGIRISHKCFLQICLNFPHLRTSRVSLQYVSSPERPFQLLSSAIGGKSEQFYWQSCAGLPVKNLVKYFNVEIGICRGAGH